jgi:2-oxoisovalerate dehydrogenase E1 component
MSLRVARRLADANVSTRVVDMRWLAPLPVTDIMREASATGRTLVVDETRASGGVAEGVMAAMIDRGYPGALARVASEDSFIPLGDAALKVLLSEDQIEAAALKLAAARP